MTHARKAIVAKTIAEFNWGNYGLDEVGWCGPDADYAQDLADEILSKLDEDATE